MSFLNDWAVLPSLVILCYVRVLTCVGQIEQHGHKTPLALGSQTRPWFNERALLEGTLLQSRYVIAIRSSSGCVLARAGTARGLTKFGPGRTGVGPPGPGPGSTDWSPGRAELGGTASGHGCHQTQ